MEERLKKRSVVIQLIAILFISAILGGCSSSDAVSPTAMPLAPTEAPAQPDQESASEGPVLIVSSDYAPYTLSDQNGSGVVLDVVRQAFAAVDIEVTFEFYPWARGESLVAQGDAFGTAPYFKTDEREKVYDFSDPIVFSFNKFFYNKENFPEGFTWNTLEDFQGYTMGGILGYWYLPAFEDAGLTVEAVATDEQNLAKLIDQRIDFTVIDEATGTLIMSENFLYDMDKIGVLEKPESFTEFHLLISRTYPNATVLTEKFNQGLVIIKGTGEYQQILDQYGIPDSYAVP